MIEELPSPPPCLGVCGRRLWVATMETYVLSPPQAETLLTAAKLADRLEECRTHLQREELVCADRFGQPKANPWAVHELAATSQLARIMDRLLKSASRRILDSDEAAEFFGGPARRRGMDLLD